MKKKVLVGLVCALALCLSFVLVGCGGGKPLDKEVVINDDFKMSIPSSYEEAYGGDTAKSGSIFSVGYKNGEYSFSVISNPYTTSVEESLKDYALDKELSDFQQKKLLEGKSDLGTEWWVYNIKYHDNDPSKSWQKNLPEDKRQSDFDYDIVYVETSKAFYTIPMPDDINSTDLAKTIK